MAETHDSNRLWRFILLACGCTFVGALQYGLTIGGLGWGLVLGVGMWVVVEILVVPMNEPEPPKRESQGFPVGGNMRAFCCPLGPPLAGAGGCGFASPDARQRKNGASTERNRGLAAITDENGSEVQSEPVKRIRFGHSLRSEPASPG